MSVGKWTTTLTLAGLGGVMLLTLRGRKPIRSAVQAGGGGRLAAWNESAREELNHIQQAVKDVEQSIESHPRYGCMVLK
jgi:hypothetical protein